MLLHAQWVGAKKLEKRAERIATPFGICDLWCDHLDGRDQLAVLFNAFEPDSYNRPGLWLAVTHIFKNLSGAQTSLTFAPVPTSWTRSAIVKIFQELGFVARVRDRVLELTADVGPSAAIARAALAAFALDPFARDLPKLAAIAQRLRLEPGLPETLQTLLEPGRGARVLRELLGQQSTPHEIGDLDKAIAVILHRCNTKLLVQFEPDGGQLLRTVSNLYPLERVIGVEPSAKRAARRVKGWELVHGTLIEPPAVPPEATALVIDGLPLQGDLRLHRAASTLFQKPGFDWVLFLDRQPWVPQWVSAEAERHGYRVSPAWKEGVHHAVMCRRTPSSVPRTTVDALGTIQIATCGGQPVSGEKAAGVREAFSKLTVDPRWLIYLPPQSATLPSDRLDEDAEHPRRVLDYYRSEGISKLVGSVKHLGSRAIVVVCRSEEAAFKRFGISALGRIYTRSGRTFFDEDGPFLSAIRDGLERAEFWSRFKTDWVCLEGDILPWSLKAEHLLAAHRERLLGGEAMCKEASLTLAKLGAGDHSDCGLRMAAYRKIVERAAGSGETSFAPRQMIAIEGRAFFSMTHLWHMETLTSLARRAGVPFKETPFRLFNIEDPRGQQELVGWWQKTSAAIFTTLPFRPKGRRGYAQPTFMCRGKEELRLIHGPEYDRPENRIWLRDRLGAVNRREKRRRILRQLALGIEGVERFVAKESIERVEECIRGVLALH